MAMISVNGTALTPDPSAFEWGLNDVSGDDAGRTRDANATMYKELITSKRKLKLTWKGVTLAEASAILRAINHEYFDVTYPDVLDGGVSTRNFYHGDLSAPFLWYNTLGGTRVSELSFDLIER